MLREVRYSGGYPGYILDKRTFNASRSKSLTLLRATIILAMAADMGRSTVSGQDGDGFARLLASATKEINYAAADIYGPVTEACPVGNPAAPYPGDAGCKGFKENFEANIPLIEARIVKVMLAALPTDKARKFLDDALKGDVMGAAWNALGAVATTVGGLHVAFARYRSGLETVAGSLPACADGKTQYDPAKHTVHHAAKCLGLSENDLFLNPDEARPDLLASATVSPRAFFMLMRGIAADCVSLDYGGKGEDLDASKILRKKACNSIGFQPEVRPFRLDSGHGETAPIATDSAPAD
ncbi:hypothetical protein J3E64_000035 [Sphingobium sp. OAS761]|uniref:hypothetical protein n=1 Tax=Sphingobium sp. OAS761 TaxID=2817901 RepID=UPI00209EB232|nr:hypothetical protein [Sphingobium sp. OAS761]MCP1468368.1 hypothetical protein [Sphingobium sp. OAS761]